MPVYLSFASRLLIVLKQLIYCIFMMFVLSVLLLKAILCVHFLVPRISNTNAPCRLNGELTLDLAIHILSSML